MPQRAFIGVPFAALAVWMLFRNPWVAPGFVCLAASNLAMTIAVRRGAGAGRAAPAALVAFSGVGYLGLAYLLALLAAGMPASVAFWAAFGGAVAVAAPIVWLAQRVFVPRKVVG